MNKIRQYRELANKSQSELGAAIGVWQTAISNYEGGIRTVDIPTAQKIVKAFNEWGLDITLSDVFPVETTAA